MKLYVGPVVYFNKVMLFDSTSKISILPNISVCKDFHFLPLSFILSTNFASFYLPLSLFSMSMRDKPLSLTLFLYYGINFSFTRA